MKRFLMITIAVAYVAMGRVGWAAEGAIALPDEPGHVELTVDASLTLGEIVRLAAEHEPGRPVLEARREEVVALEREARGLLANAPTLSASNVNSRAFSDDGYQQWDTALELPLYWPGQRSARRRTAQAANAAVRHASQVHLLEVAGWVREALTELALARLRLELAEAALQSEEALAAQVARAVELEELARADGLLAQSARLDRQLEYLQALEEARHAESNYFLLTGLDRWPERWEESPVEAARLEDHPLRRMAAEEVARAEAELQRLVGDQWGNPILALGTQHERDRSGADYSDRLMFGLQIPIGRRAGAPRQTAALRLRVSELRRDAGRLDRDLRRRLARAEHAHLLAEARVGTASEQAAMAAEFRRLSELGFGLGETDLGTVLRARARARTAEQSRRVALLLRQSSVARLHQALGVLP